MRIFIFLLIALVIIGLPGCKPKQSPAEHIYNQGSDYLIENKPKEALEQFQKALAIDPNHEDACLQIAYIYEEQFNDNDKAIEYYNRFLEISSNERIKEKVKLWIEEAKASLKKSAPASTDEFKNLDPNTRKRVKKILAEKEAQFKKALDKKDKELANSNSRELETLKETLSSFKLEIIELKDKAENLTIERNDLQKKVRERQTRAKIADVLNSPALKGGVKKLKQNLIEIKSEQEGLKIQVEQEINKSKQLEEENVKLRQRLAEARKIKLSSDKTKALSAQLRKAQENNQLLADKLKIAKNAGAASEESEKVKESFEKEIRNLQNQVLKSKKEQTAITITKNSLEQKCAELEDQVKALLKHSTSLEGGKDFIHENRVLRLEIAKLTSQFNDMSVKKSLAEQRANELENEVESYKNIPEAAKPVIASDFTDLSDEILQMQSTIEEKNEQLTHKDKQISILKGEFSEIQNDFDKIKTDSSKDELIDELNKKLISNSDTNQKLKYEIAKLNREKNKYKSADENAKALAYDMKGLNSELLDKNRKLNEYAVKIKRYSEAHKAALEKIRRLEVQNQEMNNKIRGIISKVGNRPTYSKQAASKSYTENNSYKYTNIKQNNRTSKTVSKRKVKTYRVKRGDSLSGIAYLIYGDKTKWQLIYSENRDILKRPNSLRAGQILIIPVNAGN